MIWDWLAGLIARAWSRMFKDWRRDQALEDKGALEERDANAKERERRRREFDDDARLVEGGDIDLRGDG